MEIVAALNRGEDINFPNPFKHEQIDRGFHYEGSAVHFILRGSTGTARN